MKSHSVEFEGSQWKIIQMEALQKGAKFHKNPTNSTYKLSTLGDI